MESLGANVLVLNPDELGEQPSVGMDLAVHLGIGHLELRTAAGRNLLLLDDDQLRSIRARAEDRGLRVAALASPLWKWCLPAARPGRVDSFGFPTRVPPSKRRAFVLRAIEVAAMVGAGRVRVFSHLRVQDGPTESLTADPLLAEALRLAERAGVRLLLENEPVCTLAHADEVLAVLERYTDRGLGLWLDVANLHEVGDATAESFDALAGYCEYVHVKDYRVDAVGRKVFCAAGTGSVPFDVAFAALSRCRPGLPYALETHVRDDPAQALAVGAAFLRRFLATAAP